jgi:DNA polymerase-3 subunit delta'
LIVQPDAIERMDFSQENLAFSCLQSLLIKAIRAKNNPQESKTPAGKILKQTDSAHLFALLEDVQFALKLEENRINLKLLLDNILIIWSHIGHLKTYPTITNRSKL